MARIATATLLVLLLAASLCGQSDSPSGDDKQARLKLVRQHLKQAIKEAKSEQYPEALASLDSVLAIDEKNADAFYYKSLVFVHSGDTAAATEVLVEGTSKAPFSARIKLLLARLYLVDGKTDQAVQLIDTVLAIKPRLGEALYLKGMASAILSDSAAAVEALAKALEITLAGGGRM